MAHIAILSSSVRTGRRSHRVALFFQRYIEANALATVDLIDLSAYDFPIFHERLKNLEAPDAKVKDFAARIVKAQGVILVTPEYNGGYPAALKNALDLLNDEWRRKPVAISTVSDGSFGGAQVLTSLQFSLWKMRAWTVTAQFPVPKVNDAFDMDGVPADPATVEKRAHGFVGELLWCVEANARMAQR